MNRVTLSFLLFWGLTIQLGQSRDKLAVIMLDGFRWDFVSRMTHLEMPSIKQLIDEGVEAVYVQPVFPSEAFPSWTTIVTGLYPESHGILANYMWDPMSEMAFDIDKAGQSDDNTNHSDWWSRHVPLWITATEKGTHSIDLDHIHVQYITSFCRYSNFSVPLESMWCQFQRRHPA